MATKIILSVANTFSFMHDLKLFRDARVQIHPETALIGDAGYQGIQRDHCLITTHKASRTQPLTPAERQENRVLASTRQCVEHATCRLKIFRVLKEVYRHRRRRFSLRVRLIAAIYTLTLQHSA